MKILFVIPTIIFFVCCKSKAPAVYIGTWEKDSSTNGPTSRLSKPYESGTLILKKNDSFYYKWSAMDVMGVAEGEFEITDSINGMKILKLMMGQQLYRKYIILETDNKRLKTSLEYSYTVYDSTIFFDMVEVFKKTDLAR